jgi:beta-N-acetylhexosaminidase
MLLMPTDPEACIRALEAAVKSGRIPIRRINASAAKVLSAKQRLGLTKRRAVDLDAVSDQIKDPKLDALADRVAEKALTLVRDDKQMFPMAQAMGSCLVIMNESEFSQRGQILVHELAGTAPGLKTYVANATMPDPVLNTIAFDMVQCKQIYVAAFVTVAAYRGSIGLQGGLSAFLKRVTDGSAPVALISLGNPYLLRDFPKVAAYAATFSSAETSEVATARAILGQIAITGKMPVSIPGVAKIGDGLTVSAKSNPTSNATR